MCALGGARALRRLHATGGDGVLQLVRRLAPRIRMLRSRSAPLADQMERALISIPLNVAEGAYSRGKNRQARFQSAAASARETLACLETAEAMGFIAPIEPGLGALFDRIIGTLVRSSVPQGANIVRPVRDVYP